MKQLQDVEVKHNAVKDEYGRVKQTSDRILYEMEKVEISIEKLSKYSNFFQFQN